MFFSDFVALIRIIIILNQKRGRIPNGACRLELNLGAWSLICCVLLVCCWKLDHSFWSECQEPVKFDLYLKSVCWIGTISGSLFVKAAFVERCSSVRCLLLATGFTSCESKMRNGPSLPGADTNPKWKLECRDKTLLFCIAFVHVNYLQNSPDFKVPFIQLELLPVFDCGISVYHGVIIRWAKFHPNTVHLFNS